MGLRERKKLRTRETIAAAATDLFMKQGYAETTIAQIAESADVSPRTVSGYFPAKEMLVFADAEEFLAGLESRLTAREGETSVDALRGWLIEFTEADTPEEAKRRHAMKRLIDGDAGLRAAERSILGRAAEIIAASVAVDLDEPGDGLLPHMVGAATMGALDALGKRLDNTGETLADEESRALIDDIVAFIGGGVAALAQRR